MQKISNTRQQMLEFLGTTTPDPTSSIELEVKKYLEIEVQESEPTDWWKEQMHLFPNISRLANFCFGIPATSSSSEQPFSHTGSCINEKRSGLNPATFKD
ncbi:hypothetical protein CVS40_4466 [Lucilia cuprina]|nr:hypothetical protein CVS40_4466 [Lucilia cuprina]